MVNGLSSEQGPIINTPEPPTVTQYVNGQVLVSITAPLVTGTEIKEIEIAYKESTKTHFRSKCLSVPQNETVIPNLVVDKLYQFKVRATNLDDDVVSEWSNSTEIKIVECIDDNPTIPGRPFLRRREGSHSITIQWNPPEYCERNVDRYEIFIFNGEQKEKSYFSDTNLYTIDNLKQMCSYTFKVRSLMQTGSETVFSELSKESEKVQTDLSIASYLKAQQDTILEEKQDRPKMSIHRLKCHPVGDIDYGNKIRHVVVGKGREIGHGRDPKYILLFGQTGAGKSTFIDLIVNHIYDVAWQDEFRLKAVDLMDDERDRDQVQSQTQWITCYEMKRRKNSMLNYDLVVIDTPGFNALERNDQDKVKAQFKSLVLKERINGLHAVCFVSNSHTGKLTENESQLSKVIAEIFNTDIRNSIFIFATCADSSKPLIGYILDKLGISYRKIYKFNNTPFTLDKQMSRAEEQRLHWKDGKDSLFKFFDKLEDLHLNSLKLPKEEILVYEQLKLKLKSKRKEVDETCYDIINSLNGKKRYRRMKERTPRGKNATVCNKCERTCCYPCNLSRVNKRLCWNIEFMGGKCVACKSTCTLDDHESGPQMFNIAPVFFSRGTEEDKIDLNLQSGMKKQIAWEGQCLTKLLHEMHDLEKGIAQYFNPFFDRDIDRTINTIMTEVQSNPKCDSHLVELILEKSKSEIKKPLEKQWKDIADLVELNEAENIFK